MAPVRKKMHGAGTTGIAGYPGLPCATGFNGVLRALPGEPDFVATVIGKTRERLCQFSASLGAPGPHDFAVRGGSARLAQPPRPSQPASTFVTTRTPLCTRRDARREDTAFRKREAEYFPHRDWTGGIALKRRRKFDFLRSDFGRPSRRDWCETEHALPDRQITLRRHCER